MIFFFDIEQKDKAQRAVDAAIIRLQTVKDHLAKHQEKVTHETKWREVIETAIELSDISSRGVCPKAIAQALLAQDFTSWERVLGMDPQLLKLCVEQSSDPPLSITLGAAWGVLSILKKKAVDMMDESN